MPGPRDRGRTPPRRLSGDESALWRHVTGGVKPLSDRDRVTKPGGGLRTGTCAPRPHPEFTRVPSPPPLRVADAAQGRRAGVDKRTAVRLRRGQMRVEATLDLHHLTQADAHRALAAFLAAAQQAGRRCVLVITGKGLRPDGTPGVLRTNVPRWLDEPGIRQRVLAFCSAVPADGGDGALYVLLRKLR